ncbi:hypothetical protein AAHC03_01268 [Spirometra sp. Aus1]|nr:unnamed protein product [Spirometra erinaceieuropaei]
MESKQPIQHLAEENTKLKQYIEELNKECMELQASLFEEANKMTQAAFGAQNKAEKRAQEKIRENNVLRAEVLALKNLLRNSQEKQDTFAMRRSVSSTEDLLPPVEFSSNRRISRQNTGASHPSSLPQGLSRPRLSSASRPSLATSIVSLTTQEPVTRKSLYEALTADGSCSLNTHSKYYKEFVDWVDGGCWLSLSQDASRTSSLLIFREVPSRNRSHSGGSDIFDADADSLLVPLNSSMPNKTSREHAFMLRLDVEDISPCLDFADKNICSALRSALPSLSLEMEPLEVKSPGANHHCPLMSGQKCAFRLLVEVPKPDGSSESHSWQISSSARQRIAAVADLFQYLTLIRRGLTGTPTSLDSPKSPDAPKMTSAEAQKTLRWHQFENVQRRRAAVALARLGYGLPLLE